MKSGVIRNPGSQLRHLEKKQKVTSKNENHPSKNMVIDLLIAVMTQERVWIGWRKPQAFIVHICCAENASPHVYSCKSLLEVFLCPQISLRHTEWDEINGMNTYVNNLFSIYIACATIFWSGVIRNPRFFKFWVCISKLSHQLTFLIAPLWREVFTKHVSAIKHTLQFSVAL